MIEVIAPNGIRVDKGTESHILEFLNQGVNNLSDLRILDNGLWQPAEEWFKDRSWDGVIPEAAKTPEDGRFKIVDNKAVVHIYNATVEVVDGYLTHHLEQGKSLEGMKVVGKYGETTAQYWIEEDGVKIAGESTAVQDEEDVINHPSHYTQYVGIEVIDLTEQMNFCRGNAVKYICRAGFKSKETEVEDLKKAVWYIQREISKLEKTMGDGFGQALEVLSEYYNGRKEKSDS